MKYISIKKHYNGQSEKQIAYTAAMKICKNFEDIKKEIAGLLYEHRNIAVYPCIGIVIFSDANIRSLDLFTVNYAKAVRGDYDKDVDEIVCNIINQKWPHAKNDDIMPLFFMERKIGEKLSCHDITAGIVNDLLQCLLLDVLKIDVCVWQEFKQRCCDFDYLLEYLKTYKAEDYIKQPKTAAEIALEKAKALLCDSTKENSRKGQKSINKNKEKQYVSENEILPKKESYNMLDLNNVSNRKAGCPEIKNATKLLANMLKYIGLFDHNESPFSPQEMILFLCWVQYCKDTMPGVKEEICTGLRYLDLCEKFAESSKDENKLYTVDDLEKMLQMEFDYIWAWCACGFFHGQKIKGHYMFTEEDMEYNRKAVEQLRVSYEDFTYPPK